MAYNILRILISSSRYATMPSKKFIMCKLVKIDPKARYEDFMLNRLKSTDNSINISYGSAKR